MESNYAAIPIVPKKELLTHTELLGMLANLKAAAIASVITHEAKMKLVQDIQNAELKIVADMNPSK